MGIIENIVIIGYLFVVGYLGFLGFRQTKNSTDYMLAGRNTHPVVMALSYGATFISTSAIVGFSGVAAWLGSSMIWLALANLFIGIFIAFAVFGDRTRRMGIRLGAHTFPEFLAKRYDSRFIQLFGGLIIAVFMPLYASAVLIGGTHFIASYFEADYHLSLMVFSIFITCYVIAGGLKGVLLTDALQGAIMFVAVLILVYFAFDALGGVTSALAKFDEVWAATVAPLADVDISTLSGPDAQMKSSLLMGFQGWNKMPVLFSDGWLYLATSLFFGVGIGVLAQPQLVVRFMTVKSRQELSRGVLIGGIFIFGVMGLTYLIGALTNVWFFEYNEGRNALQSAGAVDKVMPLFITMAMPKWFSFIFLFALISAAMSTLSAQFHTMGTAIGRDIYEQIFRRSGSNSMLITRVGIVVMILCAVVLSYLFDKQPAIIARSTTIFFALCASVFLPSYIAALFWRRATRTGAIASMIAGAATSAFWLLFVHFQEAKALGFCKWLFGVDSIFSGKIIYIDALIFALPLSALTLVVVSMMSKGSEELAKRSF
jgi:SSS family solute:Na+ symporter